MSGTRSGGLKTVKTNKERYGDDFYKEIGSIGGKISRGGGFAANHDLAVSAGRKGGMASRKKAKDKYIEEAKIQEKQHKSWRKRLGL